MFDDHRSFVGAELERAFDAGALGEDRVHPLGELTGLSAVFELAGVGSIDKQQMLLFALPDGERTRFFAMPFLSDGQRPALDAQDRFCLWLAFRSIGTNHPVIGQCRSDGPAEVHEHHRSQMREPHARELAADLGAATRFAGKVIPGQS